LVGGYALPGPWLKLNFEPRPLGMSRSTAHSAQVIRPLDYTGRYFKMSFYSTSRVILRRQEHVQRFTVMFLQCICNCSAYYCTADKHTSRIVI